MKTKTLEKKIKFKGETEIEVIICDQGHYGLSYCGNCSERIPDDRQRVYCEKCNYKFVGSKRDYNRGGSDFE